MSAELWLIGTLVTILIAVLSSIAGILKVAYDMSRDVRTALYGNPSNGNEGFIQRAIDTHNELSDEQSRINENLRVQGDLLTELTYGVAEIADSLAEHEEFETDVNTERIERLRGVKRDKYDD